MPLPIYVGNLSFRATEQQLAELFGEYGTVLSTQIPLDRVPGRQRGFGFVRMEDVDARRAIAALNASTFLGRRLAVGEARERPGCTLTPPVTAPR